MQENSALDSEHQKKGFLSPRWWSQEQEQPKDKHMGKLEHFIKIENICSLRHW